MRKCWYRKCIVIFVITGTLYLLACGGGGGSEAEPAVRLSFVTSTTGTGDLSTWADAGGQTGLLAADNVCQARADTAGLPGTFVAWMSDSTDDAYCRAHGLTGKKDDNCGQGDTLPTWAGPWTKVDGSPFIAQLDVALDDGVVFTAANMDEFGDIFTAYAMIRTGNHLGGIHYEDNTCADWTTTEGFGAAGHSFKTTGQWSTGHNYACSNSYTRLLCLETGNNNTLPDFEEPGKVVFLSSVSGQGRLGSWAQAGGEEGLAAGDAICQNLASSAGLARASSFKAWLSVGGTNAGDRFGSGPWTRMDGVKVADSMSSLINTGPLTAINVTENMDYVGWFEYVYSGTTEAGVLAAQACSDWTSNSSDVSGEKGQANMVSTSWTAQSSWACQSYGRLYCFED